MEIKLTREDVVFIAFAFIYAVVLFCLSLQSSLTPDEGTHATVALFYRDIITNVFRFHDLGQVWSFGQAYLAHYPKLQVTYPPFWHLTTAVVFYSLFGVSAFSAKLSTLFFSLCSMALMYLLVKKLVGPVPALLATFLFYANALSVIFGVRALIDFSAYLFIFAALLSFSKAFETRDWRLYALTGFLSFLAVMGQRPAILLFPFLFLYMVIKKERKNLVPLTLAFAVPIIIYAAFMVAIGGLAINYNVVQQAGDIQGEPPVTSWESWIWYFAKFYAITGPVALLIAASFALYVYKREKGWQFFLAWFLVMWIGLTVPQNKEPRFYQMIFWPAYIAFAHYAVKYCRQYGAKAVALLSIIAAAYLFSSFLYVSNNTGKLYPVDDVIDYAFSNGSGNIGMPVESGYAYSSAFIFRQAQLDVGKERYFFRPCAFYNKTPGEIAEMSRENSIEWLIIVGGNVPAAGLPDDFALEKKFGDIELYRLKDFVPGSGTTCNIVCLTEQVICPSSRSPFDILISG